MQVNRLRLSPSSGPLSQLSHLFLEDFFDLQRIVDAQVQLKVLGVFWGMNREAILSLVSQINGRSLCVVQLNGGARPYMDYYINISLHPSLLDLEHARDLRAIVRQSERLVTSRVGLELDWEEIQDVYLFIEIAPAPEVLEALMVSLSSLPELSGVYVYAKPGLVRHFSSNRGFGANILLAKGLEVGICQGSCPALYC